MADIKNLRVATLATDGVEEAELLEPLKALKDSGAAVKVLSLQSNEIQCFNHHDKSSRFPVDGLISAASPDDFDALLLPGGALNADLLRADPDVKRFVHAIDAEKKPIAVICHAPWILISACVVKDRTLTSFYTIEDDIRNAGGHWVDREVVMDFNWVSSRKPADIPAFNREMLTTFATLTRTAQPAR